MKQWRFGVGIFILLLAVVIGWLFINHKIGGTEIERLERIVTAFQTDTQGRYLPDTVSENQHCHAHDGLPDHACTPGAVNPEVTQANIQTTICKKGFTKTIRPPQNYTNDLKRTQMKAYGFSGPLNNYEEDHQISLELGGDPSNPANLWPEPHAPFPGSFDKDHVENYLRTKVCDGSLPLATAQALIATDWVNVYNTVGRSITNY